MFQIPIASFLGASIFFFIQGLVKLVSFKYFKSQCYKYDEKLNIEARCIIFDGAPGAGKTVNSIYYSIKKATLQFKELEEEYLLSAPISAELFKNALFNCEEESLKKWTNYSTTAESLNFYNSIFRIPCLYSNIKFKYNGLKPIELKREHITQLKRLAERPVMLFDEFAEVASNKESKKSAEGVADMNNFFSLYRQFVEGNIIGNEQRSGEIFLGARAVFNYTYYLIAQKWLLKPIILELIYKKLFETYAKNLSKLLKYSPKTAVKFATMLQKFKKFIKKIGFRRFEYTVIKGAENKLEQNKNEKFIFMPCDLPFDYDERERRNEYKAKNLNLSI